MIRRSAHASARQDWAVHLVEPGGRGGVFQHTVGLAETLNAAGRRVVVHTAYDAELTGDAGVTICRCVRWARRLPNGVRQPLTAMRYLLVTVPHIVTATHRRDIVHMQGLFGYGPTALAIVSLRLTRRAVAFSPHNTFARSGRRRHRWTLAAMCRLAQVVFVFSAADAAAVARWSRRVQVADLAYKVEEPDPERVAVWRARYGTAPAAILAGQVRNDKRPDLFVQVCALAGVTAVVVGEALDGEAALRSAELAAGIDVLRYGGYLELADFTAAVAAADVVVLTHGVASSSGAIAVADALGVPSVAPPVGGLAEAATVAAESDSAESLASAVAIALALPSAPTAPGRGSAAMLAGYGQLGRHG